MSLGFFYNRLDWINHALIAELEKQTAVEMIDVGDFSLDVHDRNAFPHAIYVNRVYPSESETSFSNIRLMLEVVRHLERMNIPVVNSFAATYADYSKTEAVSLLESENIPTVPAQLFANVRAALQAGKAMSFPKVVKTDCGGKARNVYKVDNYADYEKVVAKFNGDGQLIHVEDLLLTQGFTTRVVVLNFEVVYIAKRSLVDDWLGNLSMHGSTTIPYPHPPQSLYALGESAARVLQAPIVSFDIAETEDGPHILDVNTTPVFTPESAEHLEFRPEIEMARIILKYAR